MQIAGMWFAAFLFEAPRGVPIIETEQIMAGSIFKASACSVAVSAVLACLSASAQQQSTRPPETGKPTTGATQGTPKSAAGMENGQTGKQATAQVARADRKFIEEATEGGLAEVELGKLAQQKSQSTMVKEFGSRMVQDHSKANDELKEIAESKGVQLPGAPDKEHQKDVEKLSKLSGAEFDREYAAHMLSDHKKDVSEFKKAADKSKDGDLKAFAGKTLPTLQEHLTMAQNLNDNVKGKK